MWGRQEGHLHLHLDLHHHLLLLLLLPGSRDSTMRPAVNPDLLNTTIPLTDPHRRLRQAHLLNEWMVCKSARGTLPPPSHTVAVDDTIVPPPHLIHAPKFDSASIPALRKASHGFSCKQQSTVKVQRCGIIGSKRVRQDGSRLCFQPVSDQDNASRMHRTRFLQGSTSS